MPKVSVLMPAYNAEKYVSKAIESVIDQTFPDWELVIVDDCSSDRTLELCEEYANRDARIKIYKQEINFGISITKNRALLKAEGKYIAFCDDDDFMDKDALLDNVALMEKNGSQVARWSYRTIRINEANEVTNIKEIVCGDGIYNSRNEIFENYKNVHTMLSCDWTGLYETAFLRDHNICFNESFLFGGEDTEFNVKVLQHIEKLAMSSKCYYDWYVRKKHSTTEKRNINFCISMMDVANKEYLLVKENCEESKDVWNEYKIFYEGLIRGYAKKLSDIEKTEVERLLTEAKWNV